MARKVLILMENYQEVQNMESVLRKIGVDALGLNKTLMLNEKIVGFSPDIIVLQPFGQRINGVELVKKIKRRRGIPKILYSMPAGTVEIPIGGDGIVEMPFDPLKFVETLGQLLKTNVNALIAKIHKLSSNESANTEKNFGPSSKKDQNSGSVYIKSGADGGAKSNRSRSYSEMTKSINISVKQTLDRNQIQTYIEKEKSTVIPNEEDLDTARQNFVRSLFKKAD